MDGDHPEKIAQVSKARGPSWEQRWVQKRHGNDAALQSHSEDTFWKDVQQLGADVLRKANNSGAATKSDLAKAISSNYYAGAEAQVAGAIYNRFDKLKSQSTFGIGDEKVTADGLGKLASESTNAEKSFKSLRTLIAWANDGGLKRFSVDGTATLSMADIQAAQKQAKLSTEDKAELAELSNNFKSVVTASGKVGLPELQSAFQKTQIGSNFHLMDEFQTDMILIENNQKSSSAHKLFANTSNPLMSIRPEAVIQGYSGDCTFKAALASLAAERPEDILRMIKVDPANSKVEVQLPGTKAKTFVVSKPTDEELGLFSNNNSDGYWSSAFEKAYGESIHNDANPIEKAKMKGEIDEMWAGHSDDTRAAIRALTGHHVEWARLNGLSDSELTNEIQSASNDKRIVVFCTPEGKGKTANGFKQGHALSLIKVSNTNGCLELTVRDPYAEGTNNPNGVMTISMQVLRKNFEAVFLESKRAAN